MEEVKCFKDLNDLIYFKTRSINTENFFDFLKYNSWKLFISKVNINVNAELDRIDLVFNYEIPILFQNDVQFCMNLHNLIIIKIQELDEYFILNQSRQVYYELSKSFIDDESFTNIFNNKYFDKSLHYWIRVVVNGTIFSSIINKPNEDRYIFIEYLFTEHSKFKEIKFEVEEPIILIKGNPKSGKTYSALYAMYKEFCKRDIDIQVVRSIKRLAQVVKESKSDKELFIYLEDPFGGINFDLDNSKNITDYLTYTSLPSNCQIIITSRLEIFDRIKFRPEINFEVFSTKIKEYSFILTSDLYNNIQYEELFIKFATIKQAKWLKSYLEFRNNREIGSLWSGINFDKTSPGNIYFLFTLYPFIQDLTVENSLSILKIIKCFNYIDNLVLSFQSEINPIFTLANEDDKKSKQTIMLYLLLPALTKIKDIEAINKNLFNKEELQTIKRYKSVIVLKEDREEKYYSYFHSSFAEAINKNLRENGDSIFLLLKDYLENKLGNIKSGELDSEFLTDLLCYYYAYDTGKKYRSPSKINFHKIFSSNNDFSYIQVEVFKMIISNRIKTDKTKCETYLLQLINKENAIELVVLVSSIIDQIINGTISELHFNRNIGKYSNFFIFFLGLLHKSKSPDKNVMMSVLLHTILSRSEKYIITSKGRQKNIIISILKKITNDFYRLKPTLTNMDLMMIWLDAIFMKIGELHYYRKTNEFLIYRLDTFELIKSIEICEIHQEQLTDIFKKVYNSWKEKVVTNYDLNEQFKGCLYFIVYWHNRCFFQANPKFINWIKSAGLSNEPESNDYFWEGVYNNISYHCKYFKQKFPIWKKERAIFSWRIDEPRIGADHSYESGLDLNRHGHLEDIDNTLLSYHAMFFTNAFIYLARKIALSNNRISKSARDKLYNLFYILNLRFPHDSNLKEKMNHLLQDSNYNILLKEIRNIKKTEND